MAMAFALSSVIMCCTKGYMAASEACLGASQLGWPTRPARLSETRASGSGTWCVLQRFHVMMPHLAMECVKRGPELLRLWALALF